MNRIRKNNNRIVWVTALLLLLAMLAAACKEGGSQPGVTGPAGSATPPSASAGSGGQAAGQPSAKAGGSGQQPDTDPDSVAVIVNKQLALPDNYKPDDLVYPDVAFLFKEKMEKRMLRKEAATALEQLFAAAEKDGNRLAGVSGFRSQATQRILFNQYVQKDGEEKAKTYSAVPGHSEHQTGLAIDVSGITGQCAVEDCFDGTPEAKWLAKHAHEYGFIIRFPKGKEEITGYQYEPWHIRYVGVKLAKDMTDRGVTLEEYFNAVPVSGKK
ncbi:MAG: D-alanyl-D-alanine carboxypeptidase family protein [Paenibacillaceae bacterium]|jgi:D-alanyl-D-alanine carboxypeptidase|nr:D-alanyl-D-alanine carboxypeptidase family protein [Paenibacillaceae bacterium]